MPSSKAIHAVIVRRGAGLDCPASTTDGVAVGGQAVRRTARDANVKPGGRYCYSVFTVGTYGSRPGVHTSVFASPPAAVSGVIAGVKSGHVVISWRPAGGAFAYTVVANSTRCATSVQDGRVVAKTQGRTATDRNAVAGTPNCYVVFAGDRFANFSVPAQADRGQMVGLKTVAASQSGSGSSAAAASSSGLSSNLTRIVAIVGIAVLLLAAVATLLVRVMNRRRDDWQYSSGRDSGRVALGNYSTGALVIPAVIALIGFALLVAVAVSL